MISMMIYDRNTKESQLLQNCAKESVAVLSEEKLEVSSYKTIEDVQRFLEKKDLLDVAFMEVTEKTGIDLAKQTRGTYEVAELLVIADSSVSPMEYLTPAVRAASLLLRPYESLDCQKVVKEFFHSIVKNRKTEPEKVLIVENNQGKIPIPFSQIYYLEVREKRIFIRLKTKEYSKYGTLDNIAKELPENFMRCHRSFIINTEYIDTVKLSENSITLEDDIFVPLSRSYKNAIKEYMNGLR